MYLFAQPIVTADKSTSPNGSVNVAEPTLKVSKTSQPSSNRKTRRKTKLEPMSVPEIEEGIPACTDIHVHTCSYIRVHLVLSFCTVSWSYSGTSIIRTPWDKKIDGVVRIRE